ncbi:MAG: DUF1700 domain-containing protein [Clostridia bacterium]|nr:DUF1700 domain-containing protein [Clostridia bacterium]
MTKQEFLNELSNGLSGLPQDDREEQLAFYSEMIDDRMEEGISETKAVEEIGSVDDIVSQIIADISFTKLVKEKITPEHTLQIWKILLIILGFPLWFPLLLSFGAVLLSLYIVIWSLIISLWAVEISLCACAISGVITSIIYIVKGYVLLGTAMLGVGLFCAGLSILLFFGCIYVSKTTIYLTKKVILDIKTWYIRKEHSK